MLSTTCRQKACLIQILSLINKNFVLAQVLIKKREKPTISKDNNDLILNFQILKCFYMIEIIVMLLKILYNSEISSVSVASYVKI